MNYRLQVAITSTLADSGANGEQLHFRCDLDGITPEQWARIVAVVDDIRKKNPCASS